MGCCAGRINPPKNYSKLASVRMVRGGGELIVAKPFVAHLYLTALYVGSYLAYACFVLKASDDILTGVDRGLSKGLKELLEPDGTPFEPTDQKNLFRLILTCCRATHHAAMPITGASAADPTCSDVIHTEGDSYAMSG